MYQILGMHLVKLLKFGKKNLFLIGLGRLFLGQVQEKSLDLRL